MKLSEIYGKEVESKDGQVHGWVRGILAKNGAPQFLQCFDDDEREFDIDVKNIICTGEKIVFEDRPAIKKQSTNMRLGVPAYSEYGNFLGYLAEIITDRSGAAADLAEAEQALRGVARVEERIADLAVTGKDLMEAGMKPGPQLGETLNRLLELVLHQPERNVKKELLEEAARIS